MLSPDPWCWPRGDGPSVAAVVIGHRQQQWCPGNNEVMMLAAPGMVTHRPDAGDSLVLLVEESPR